MNLYTREDMLYTDYDWNSTTENSPKLNGSPDRNLFSSNEGCEVLYMINHLMEELGLKSKEEGQAIETLIHDKLPLAKQSQVTVKRWLQEKLTLAES
jgi:hypothetical protein